MLRQTNSQRSQVELTSKYCEQETENYRQGYLVFWRRDQFHTMLPDADHSDNPRGSLQTVVLPGTKLDQTLDEK